MRPVRPQQPVVKLQLHSAGDASPLHPTAHSPRRGGPGLTALLLPQIFPILHPTVHKTHGGGPALRSSRRSAGVPTARTVRHGVDHRGASPPRCHAGLSPRAANAVVEPRGACAMTSLDWLMIAAYFGVLAALTWWAVRKNKETADDYFLAGRNLGWAIIGASIFASNIGSEH